MISINVKVLVRGSNAHSLLWHLHTDHETETPCIFETVPAILSMYEVVEKDLKDIVKILRRRTNNKHKCQKKNRLNTIDQKGKVFDVHELMQILIGKKKEQKIQGFLRQLDITYYMYVTHRKEHFQFGIEYKESSALFSICAHHHIHPFYSFALSLFPTWD